MSTKKLAFRTFLWLSLFVVMAVAPVFGQSDNIVTVQIPFPFFVSNSTFPAGEYTVEPLAHINGGLLIRNTTSRVSKIFLGRSFKINFSSNEGLLVFHRYGEQYFLSQILGCRNNYEYELLPSRAERDLIKQAPSRPIEIASLRTHRR